MCELQPVMTNSCKHIQFITPVCLQFLWACTCFEWENHNWVEPYYLRELAYSEPLRRVPGKVPSSQ